MKIYDLTIPLSSKTLTWPGQRPPKIRTVTTVKRNGVALSEFQLSAHAGTHVDTPKHFLPRGQDLESYPLEQLIGPARIVSIPRNVTSIRATHLRSLRIKNGERILLKTDNTRHRRMYARTFPKVFTSLSPDGARWLVSRNIGLIGTDFLGIEARRVPGHPTHTVLLSAGIPILEGLDVSETPVGSYQQLVVAPLRVISTDGAPARVFLIK